MAAHKHKIQYACGLYRQTSGDSFSQGKLFVFPLFVPKLRDDKATVASEAKLDKHSACNKNHSVLNLPNIIVLGMLGQRNENFTSPTCLLLREHSIVGSGNAQRVLVFSRFGSELIKRWVR